MEHSSTDLKGRVTEQDPRNKQNNQRSFNIANEKCPKGRRISQRIYRSVEVIYSIKTYVFGWDE